MFVYVVSCPSLGWDCVIGVYLDTVLLEDLEKMYRSDDGYVIMKFMIETNAC
jgi:hypothetical protein